MHFSILLIFISVAFSEVYGYGFRPYEYLPAPNHTDIYAEAKLLQSGMYGLRSPIYPKMFMVALRFAKIAGLDQSPFMVRAQYLRQNLYFSIFEAYKSPASLSSKMDGRSGSMTILMTISQ